MDANAGFIHVRAAWELFTDCAACRFFVPGSGLCSVFGNSPFKKSPIKESRTTD
jgi:hypothetical protein